MQRGNVSKQSGRNGLTGVTEVRRPAPVLVDGQSKPLILGEVDQTLAQVQLQDKRFLA